MDPELDRFAHQLRFIDITARIASGLTPAGTDRGN